jgi:NAD(P)-dependent dehydrogenase (short-subunit alcohol dehydrogenase family)
MSERSLETTWGLILGASSGFGAATALELGRRGMNIFGVHLDRKATLPNVGRIEQALAASGVRSRFFNINAADHERRRAAVDEIASVLGDEGGARLHLVMHSLAFGALKPFIAERLENAVTAAQLEMTLDVMANTLVYWVQDLVARGLLARGSHVVAMTSGGGARVIPSYGAVSAAKAALESHVRQLAFELGPAGITVNGIRAGITDTPALRKIPGYERLVEDAQRRNPAARLTQPDDVAQAVAVLCMPGTHWITGGVICVDGGENVVG